VVWLAANLQILMCMKHLLLIVLLLFQVGVAVAQSESTPPPREPATDTKDAVTFPTLSGGSNDAAGGQPISFDRDSDNDSSSSSDSDYSSSDE